MLEQPERRSRRPRLIAWLTIHLVGARDVRLAFH